MPLCPLRVYPFVLIEFLSCFRDVLPTPNHEPNLGTRLFGTNNTMLTYGF